MWTECSVSRRTTMIANAIWLTPTSQRIAKADHHGQQYSTKVETGYTFMFEDRPILRLPYASLGYNYLRMNDYKEKGPMR